MGSFASIAILTSFSVVIFIGLVGNTLVILVVSKSKYLLRKKPISLVLLNLAVADCVVLVFLAPRHVFFTLIDPYPEGELGDYLCKFITGGNVAWIGAITSICSLLIIAAERYYAVCLPHKYSRTFTLTFVKRLLAGSWCFGIVFNISLFVITTYSKEMNFCMENWSSEGLSKANAVTWVVTAGFIPLCLMIFFYSNVIFTLWIKKSDSRNGQLVSRQVREKTRRRVSKALLVISFLYCASWFPPLTNYILVNFVPERSFSNTAYLASVVMVAFNSAVNPMIYAFYSGLFRQHLRNLVLRKLVPRRVTAMDHPNPLSASNNLTTIINKRSIFNTDGKQLEFSNIVTNTELQNNTLEQNNSVMRQPEDLFASKVLTFNKL